MYMYAYIRVKRSGNVYIRVDFRTCWKHASIYTCTYIHVYIYTHGVATVSRIDKIIGLFCRILSLL